MPSAEIAPPDVRWDLNFLYAGIDDPAINETWASVQKRAEALAQRYRGKIASLPPADLNAALVEFESLWMEAAKPLTLAHLLFSCDSSDPKVGGFLADQSERYTGLTVQTMFFELEIQEMSDEGFAQVAHAPELARYHHYLEVARLYVPHRLSEKEEIIIEETSNTGSKAWVRFFEELLANAEFDIVLPDSEPSTLTEPEVLALLRDPKREVRLAAAASLSRGLEKLEKQIVFVYNTLLLDKKTGDRLRTYDYPEQSRHMSNELSKEIVDMVVELCQQNHPLVERFYNVKRDILGLDKLTHVDRYAPLHATSEKRSFEEGRAIVLNALGAFSPTLEAKAAEFFDKNWIDAEPRKGKQGGAYCNSVTPDTHPVVFMNYQNKLDDVMTLAHELGHGVHGSLSRAQTYLNFHTTLPLAECASTFAEMLVFESLVKEASNESKLSLYAEKIEGIFATIMRQASMFRFERRAHNARREQGELTPETLHTIYQEEMQSMFGNSVELGPEHAKWWLYVGHFFFAPFYVYAYAIGELLVLALFERAKTEGPEFAAKYEALLTAGGSMSPQDLMKLVDVDLNEKSFWEGGFQVLERMISTFEELWQKQKES